MQILDNESFEAYKRLDRLCSDIYGCHNGVSRYIEDMERASYGERFAVPSWEQAYKTLKHLRWVRNQIAHDSAQVQICEERDIYDVNAFYDAIISGCDPLTQLRRYRASCADVKKPVRRAEPAAMPAASRHPAVSRHSDHAQPTHRRIGCLGCFGAAILLLVCAAAIIVYLLTNLT